MNEMSGKTHLPYLKPLKRSTPAVNYATSVTQNLTDSAYQRQDMLSNHRACNHASAVGKQ